MCWNRKRCVSVLRPSCMCVSAMPGSAMAAPLFSEPSFLFLVFFLVMSKCNGSPCHGRSSPQKAQFCLSCFEVYQSIDVTLRSQFAMCPMAASS